MALKCRFSVEFAFKRQQWCHSLLFMKPSYICIKTIKFSFILDGWTHQVNIIIHLFNFPLFYQKPSFLSVRPRFWPKIKKLAKKLEAFNCLHGRKLGYFQDKIEKISASRSMWRCHSYNFNSINKKVYCLTCLSKNKYIY